MKTSSTPPSNSGANSPCRFRPVAQWRRTAVADLIRPPGARDTHRIKVQTFPFPDTSGSGYVRTSIVFCPFLVSIGQDHDLQGRFENGEIMALDDLAYCRKSNSWVPVDCPPEMQAQIYRNALRSFVQEIDGIYAAGEGRN